MLHGVCNMTKIGNMLIQETLEFLTKRLPSGWRATPKPAPAKAGLRPDLLLEIRGPNGQKGLFVIESKAQIEPKDVAAIAGQLRRYLDVFGKDVVPFLISPYLSARTRERLASAQISYADRTGNVRVTASRPPIYIESQGADRDPNRSERPARSLKGAKAGRIVRALCDALPPFGVRALAEQTGINPGYVSRVLAFLDKEDLIKREARGPITTVRWRELIQRWAQDYSFMNSNRVHSFLEPRDVSRVPSKLVSAKVTFAVTGTAAAATVAPVAPTRLIAVYVENPEEAARRLELRPAESGANVLLAEPYDSVVHKRVREKGGVRYAALSQVAVDLLTGPGRGPSEAEALLNWMESHESSWRG